MAGNSNEIGKKTTFWKMVNDKITIPTLQRDYIYGAGTEKTEEVLNHMLDTFDQAIKPGNEETLDFVYGSESRAKEFIPLDGQQRLTTLYLLHFYAALIAKHSDEFTKEDEAKIFEILGKFSYATRNSTTSFCKHLLIGKYEELKKVVSKAKDGDEDVFGPYLKDLDEFRGSFFIDPSVMSMIVVLDRIHKKFRGMDGLWDRLIADDCPINFYQLDFGVFDLSDDLYNKMNSRGKPLTDFEIFKAKMHKQMIKWDRSKADDIAIKMDTSWMQYIWETLPARELKMVDPAYMCFLKNLFCCFDFLAGYDKQRFDKLDDNCMRANASSVWRIKAMESVFDMFSGSQNKIPVELRPTYDTCIFDCINGELSIPRILRLYSFYLGLYYKLGNDEFCFRYRHVNNLINNSSNYLRDVNMHNLLADVTHVMQGKILGIKPIGLNDNSWKEEQEKERYRATWTRLFDYEDIEEINGTINAFALGLNSTNTLTLGDPVFVDKLLIRLGKAAHFFNDNSIKEHERRSALLSLGCYAMANTPAYRYFGIIKTSWRNFTGYHRFDERYHFIDVIDKIDVSHSVRDLIGDVSSTSAENWRYYAIKYARQITVGNNSQNYGYMYFFGVDDKNPFDETQPYLDVAVLRSTYFSSSNVAWKMMHRILDMVCSSTYHMYIYHLGAAQIYLNQISNNVQLDMQADGWHLIGVSTDDLDAVGISYSLIKPYMNKELDNDGNVVTPLQLCDCLVSHIQGNDYIDEGQSVLEKLSTKYPSLRK